MKNLFLIVFTTLFLATVPILSGYAAVTISSEQPQTIVAGDGVTPLYPIHITGAASGYVWLLIPEDAPVVFDDTCLTKQVMGYADKGKAALVVIPDTLEGIVTIEGLGAVGLATSSQIAALGLDVTGDRLPDATDNQPLTVQ